MKTVLTVGVSGGSGAGKHVLIRDHLLPALGSRALLIEHDWYYYELEPLFKAQGVSSREDINYDIPQAYENALLVEHIRALKAGNTVTVHPYVKGSGMRDSDPIVLEPREVVVVDGMMIYAVPELVAELDLKAYVDASDALRLERRVKRDMSFSTVEESLLRFERDVLPSHRRFVEPYRATADFVLKNETDGANPDGVERFIAEVLSRLSP